jgi:hypothetical protein
MSKKFLLVSTGERHFIDKSVDESSNNLGRSIIDDDALKEIGGVTSQSRTSNSNVETSRIHSNSVKPTILEELLIVLSFPCYVFITLGYAALTGVLIGLATFGSSFFLGLNLFDRYYLYIYV